MATDIDTDTRVEAEEQVTRPDGAAATRADAAQLHFYSTYLHVGPGAAECEERETGACSDPTHFHAWCRLPNKLQHRDIVEKALAAKARRVRALKDPESDAAVTMDAELANLDEGMIEAVIDEIVSREWDGDYAEAVNDAAEQEQFEHILQDRERYLELIHAGEADKPEDEQSSEYRDLEKHIQGYIQWLKERTAERQIPRREGLRAQGFTRCMEIMRDQRVDRSADAEFSRVLTHWIWFVGTMDPEKHAVTGKPFKRMWTAMGEASDPQPGTMFDAAPEVIEALEGTFEKLNRSLVQASVGNS